MPVPSSPSARASKRPDRAAPRPTGEQFACLPWRRTPDGAVTVLVITSRETRRWVIPKGWPMPGKTPSQAAAQEAYEEAGVVGDSSPEAIGVYRYDKRLRLGAARPVEVQVFGLEVIVERLSFPERSQRDKRWTSRAEAADLVDEPELKTLIRNFAP